jgi:hypothetical protein
VITTTTTTATATATISITIAEFLIARRVHATAMQMQNRPKITKNWGWVGRGGGCKDEGALRGMKQKENARQRARIQSEEAWRRGGGLQPLKLGARCLPPL